MTTAQENPHRAHIGRRVLVYDTLESTNTEALRISSDAASDGTVIQAMEQSAGRGQQGRQWQCPRGAGVLLSAIVFPPTPLQRPALLTALAAVSVCEMIRETTGLQAKIKWPNDVLIQGRKVCGILIERGQGIVIGIGLNLNQSRDYFDAAELAEATSLALETGKSFDVRQVVETLIDRLDEEYGHLAVGDIVGLESRWKWRLGLLGKVVQIECLAENYIGRLRDIAFGGAELELQTGKTLSILPETIRQLKPD